MMNTTSTRAGLAGAISAGLALGLTELIAGITELVPSAIASVGSIVIDLSPRFVKEFAINVFGTADKGALAIGTAIVGVLVGWFVGRAARTRPWVAWVAFGAFALVGILAAADGFGGNLFVTIVAISASALAGVLALRYMLNTVETPTDGLSSSPSRRRFIAQAAGMGTLAAVAGLGGRRLIIARSEEVRQSVALPVADLTVPAPRPKPSLPASPT